MDILDYYVYIIYKIIPIKIIYFTQWTPHKPLIFVSDPNRNTRFKYNLNLQKYDYSNQYSQFFEANADSGICYVNNFKLLSFVTHINNNLNSSKLCDIIFVSQ